jgi:hypothetical protein
MPELVGFEPRFDAAPLPRAHQPGHAARPLYWWAKDLRERGDILMGLRFDATTVTATVTIRLASYRVLTVIRRADDKPQAPRNVAELLAEGVWRLGALGWSDLIGEAAEALTRGGLMTAAAPLRGCTRPIPGWERCSDRGVRIAYWFAAALMSHGWRLHACGDAAGRYGFIAEIPAPGGGADLVVYPGDIADDGTEASALANLCARLGFGQRAALQRIVSDAAAGTGQVI